MHLNQELLFKKYALTYFKDNSKVLEIGPAGIPSLYRKLLTSGKISEWHYLDVSTKFIGNIPENEIFILSENPYNYPLKENTYDIILAGSVIGHIPKIWIWMQELHRILKPGGLVIIISAVSYPPCPSPVDTWRIYPDGLKALFDDFGFDTIISEFDSLEPEFLGYNRKYKHMANFRVAGVSLINPITNTLSLSNKLKLKINRVLSKIYGLRRFMNPVQIAYDTIGIAQKREVFFAKQVDD